MAKAQQINVDAFDKLEQKIKQVYGELVKLDTKLDPVVVKRFTEIATGVNQIANAVIKLGKAADNDLKAAGARIRTLFQEVQKLDRITASAGKLNGDSIIRLSNSVYRFSLAMKEAGQIVLSNNPLKNLTDAIKAFIKDFTVSTKDMNKVEKNLDTFSSLIRRIYNSFSKVTTGPPLDLKGLKVILDFYKSFQKTITTGNSGNITAVEKDLVAFISIIRRLSSSLAKASGMNVNPAALTPLLDFYKTFLQAMKTTGAPGAVATLTKDFTDFFKSINSILRSVSKLNVQNANIAAVQTGVKDLIDLYNAFQTAFATTTPGGPGSAASTTATITKQIAEFKSIIREILGIIKIIPTGKINVSQLKDLQAAFTEIMKFYGEFGDLVSQQADNSTATLTSRVLSGLGALLQGIGTFFASRSAKGFLSSIGDLIVFRLALGQAVNIMKQVIKTVDGMDNVRVEAVAKFAKGMGGVLSGLSDFFKTVISGKFFNFSIPTFVQRIIQIRLGLIPLGLVLDKLRPLFKNANEGDVSAVAGFTKAVAAIFNSLTSLFELFSKRENGANFGTIAKVWLALQATLKPVINLLSQLRKLPKNINFEGLNKIFNGLSTFVDSIQKLASASTGKSINAKAIKAQLSAITEIMNLEGLRKLGRNTREIGSFGTAINAISGLLTSMAKMTEISDFKQLNELNNLNFGWLSQIAKEFKKAAKYVADLDPADIAKIEAAYKALAVIGDGKAIKNAVPMAALQSVEEFSNTITRGVVDAVFQIRLFDRTLKVLIGTVKLLNPAALVGYFYNVYQSILPALTRLKEFGGQIKDFGNLVRTNFGLEAISNSNLFQATVEFDKLGSSLEVFGGFTKEQRAEAEAFANTLGKDYPLSANEAMQALLDLTKAGQSLESAKIILPAAADLAALSDSGSIEQATAAIIQINASFKQLNDTTATSFANSALAVDILAAAADSSTASVESLAQGLANVGPVANQFGLTLEETAAILAIFSDGGIKGAEAGTQLKSLLTNLTTDTAQKELKKLGIAYTDAAGNIRPINDIITDINTKFTENSTVTFKATKRLTAEQQAQLDAATKAYSAAQRTIANTSLGINAAGAEGGERAANAISDAQKIADNAAAVIASITGSQEDMGYITAEIRRTEAQNAESLKNIAGSYGQAGLAILLAQGEDGLNEFIQKMREVEPAAVRARKALDNMAGDVIQLQGSIETLGTRFLGPMLEKFFRPFVKIGRFVADTFLTIDTAVFDFAATAVGLLATFGSIVGVIGVVVGAIIQLGASVASLTAFWVLSQRLITGALIAGIAGFAAGIASLAAGFLILAPIVTVITSAFNSLYEIFTKDLGGAATALKGFADQIGLALGDIGSFVGELFTLVSTVLAGPTSKGLEGAGKGIALFFDSLALGVKKSRESGILKYISDMAEVFKLLTANFTLLDRVDAAGDQAAIDANDNDSIGQSKKQARAVAKARQQVSDEYAATISELAKNNGIIRALFTDGTDVSAEGIQAFLNERLGALNTVRDSFLNIFKIGFAGAALSQVLKPGDTLAAIGAFFNSIIDNLDNTVGDFAAAVLDAFGLFFNIDTSALSKIFLDQGFGAGIGEAFSNIGETIRKFFVDNRDSIKDAFTWVFEKMALSTLSLIENVLSFLGLSHIAYIFEDIINTITGAFRALVDTFLNLASGQDLKTALKNAFGPGIEPLLNFVSELSRTVDLVIGIMGQLISALFPKDTAAGTGGTSVFIDGLNTTLQGITTFLKFINDNFLQFLADGNIEGAISNVRTFIETGVANIAKAIGDFFKAINLGQILADAAGFFGGIAEGILAFFQNLFKDVDFGKILSDVLAQIGNVLSSIGNEIGRIVGQIDLGRVIRDVRRTIEKIIRNVVNFIRTNGPKALNAIGDFIRGLIEGALNVGRSLAQTLNLGSIVEAFESLITFVQEIFAGKDIGQALLDLFGPGIQPVLDIVDSLGEAVQDIIEFIQSIVDAIFNPSVPGGESPIQAALQSIIDAFDGVVTWVREYILGPLGHSNIGGALSNLATGVLNFVSSIASAIAAEINRLDLPTVFSNVTTAILDGLSSAIGSALGAISEITGLDTTAFVTGIDTALSGQLDLLAAANTFFTAAAGSILNLLVGALSGAVNGITTLVGFDASNFLNGLDAIMNNSINAVEGGGGVFQLVTGTIAGLLSAALGGVFDIIGELTGIDPDAALKKVTDALQGFVDRLTNMFTGNDDGTTIIDNIATIIGNIVEAFKSLIDLVNGEGGAAGGGGGEGGYTLFQKVLQAIVDFSGNLVASGINTLSDFVDGINQFFDSLAELDSGEILAIAGAMGVLALELKGISLISGLLTTINAIRVLFSIMRAEGGFAFLKANSLSLLREGLIGLANITGFTTFVTSFKDFIFFAQTYGLKAATLSYLGTGIRAVGSAIRFLSTSMIGKAAAILVIFEAFRALATNISSIGKALKSLIHLDIAGVIGGLVEGITGFGTDLAFNILELLGIDNIFGITRDEFKRMGAMMAAMFELGLRQVGLIIEQFVTSPLEYLIYVTIPLLLSNLKEVGIRALAATGNVDAQRAVAGFDLADSIFFNQEGFGATVDGVKQNVWAQGLIDSLTLAGPDAIFRAQINAKAGFDAISDVFIAEMQRTDLSPEQQAQFLSEQVKAFNFLGIFDEALVDVAKSGDVNLLQNFLSTAFAQGVTVTPEMVAGLGQSIREGFNLANFDEAVGKIDQLTLLIEQFQLAGIDPAELIKVRDDLQNQVDTFQETGEMPPVEVTADVEATIGDTTVTNPEVVAGGAQGAVDAAVPEGGVPVDVPVKPRLNFLPSADGTMPTTAVDDLNTALQTEGFGFDLSTLEDPTAVQDFDALVQDLTTHVVTLAAELNGLPSTQGLVTAALSEIQSQITVFRDTTIPMFGEVNDAITPVKESVDAVNASMTTLTLNTLVSLPLVSIAALGAAFSINMAFSSINASAALNIDPAISKINDLATALREAADAATALGNITINTVPGSGGSDPEGRASGGYTRPYNVYELHDTDEPEVYKDGERTLLFTGARSGFVTPASDTTDFSASRRTGIFGGGAALAQGPVRSTNAGNSVTIVEGDINVTVSGANVTNEAQLVARVAKAVEQQQSRRNDRLSDKLRRDHR